MQLGVTEVKELVGQEPFPDGQSGSFSLQNSDRKEQELLLSSGSLNMVMCLPPHAVVPSLWIGWWSIPCRRHDAWALH